MGCILYDSMNKLIKLIGSAVSLKPAKGHKNVIFQVDNGSDSNRLMVSQISSSCAYFPKRKPHCIQKLLLMHHFDNVMGVRQIKSLLKRDRLEKLGRFSSNFLFSRFSSLCRMFGFSMGEDDYNVVLLQ